MTKTGLEGKVVLITGAARGIGAEMARIAAQRGARMALVGLEPERLVALARSIGGAHASFGCDVTDQESIGRAVRHVVDTLGGIDVVVANAGIANNGTVAVSPADALARTVEVNLIGVMRTVSATLPMIEERRGHYLLISSASAFHALPGMAAYSASKIGVEYFGNALRLESVHKGITVGVAQPCWIETDLVRDMRRDFGVFDEMLERLPYPFGRTTPVEECARALVDAVERRRRKVYVPASLAVYAPFRSLCARMVDWSVARQARAAVPKLEAEARALGRPFGALSVETPGAKDVNAFAAQKIPALRSGRHPTS
jgi:NAD(P)-dependent dehydrogenase (short-subunit alcohol dehydrogenase family)